MGHLSHHKAHRDLQQHLDRCQTGFPESPQTMRILELLFTREEAELVARLPFRPRTARFIARRVGQPEAEIQSRLEGLADKGLILDLYNPRTEKMYYLVAPPVVGFVEFTMMRRRDDLDQLALAEAVDRCYDVSAGEGPDPLLESLFSADTVVGRTLVHEPALGPDELAELVDHERAKAVLEGARRVAVSMCYCRHKAEHLGKRCDKPMDNCLSVDVGADFVLRHGNGREIDRAEALEILDEARQAGLVHIGDNVQSKLSYICNCCGCCCGQLQAINRADLPGAVKTSNHIAVIDATACKGCGRCARVCPIQAVALRARRPGSSHGDTATSSRPPSKMVGEIDESVCLGCGVCEPACREEGALTLKRREERVLTPAGTLERIISMALERGKLHNLLFEEQDGPHMALLNRFAGAVLRLPPVKQALLRDQLKSRFVGFLARQMRGDVPITKQL
jgi:Pyruvate/2-oxoacid:ferredoxin oxidoreductase delta subunit